MPKPGMTRRNGMLQACEECRKAKSRCGHETPICRRCVRRQTTCIYDPAPMSKSSRPRLTAGNGATPQNPALDEQNHAFSSYSSPNFQTPLPDTTASSPQCSLFKKPLIGYVTTQFNAVFLENQEKYHFESMLSPNVEHGAENNTALTNHTPQLPSFNNVKIQFGIDILRRFPTPRTQEALLDFLDHFPDPWISPRMVKHYLSLDLQRGRTAGSLKKLSSEFCTNGEAQINVAGSDEWQNWFSGSKLRWEMIGILFTVFGRAFYSRQEMDPVFDWPEQGGRDRKTAATFMSVCARDCLQICRETSINDMIVVLTKNFGRLESVLLGNDNEIMTGYVGSFMSSFMAVGLHRLPKATAPTPLSEWRNGIAASAYSFDKLESIFHARPPYLNRLYCTYQMPLDLSDDELHSGQAAFEAAVRSLDANGWNTKGEIYASTWCRARCCLAPVWEEILENSLGVDTKFCSSDIDKLIQRLDRIKESWPHHIRYSNISEWWKKRGRASEIYLTTGIHLDVLQCHFLLQRLKVSRGFASEQNLLEVAHQMMAAVLSFWLNRDRLVNHMAAFDWFIMRYGIPSAGVLCVELLKSAKEAPTMKSQVGHFPRSKVIQSLTMFLGFLDWIRPSDANHRLCRRLRDVINGILDSVLDTTSHFESSSIPENSSQVTRLPSDGNGDLYSNSMEIPMIDRHATDWLNMIDWTQGDWLDFNMSTPFQ